MKLLFTNLLLLFSMFSFGQNFPFTKDFIPAALTLSNGSEKSGFIKWSTHQNDKLRFKETESSEPVKYSPGEIAKFSVDTQKYKPLFDIEIYGENFALLGKTSRLKQSFAQVLHEGNINVYFLVYSGFDPMVGAAVFPNVIFERVNGDKKEYAAFPIGVRMRDKRYEAAKEKLYTFFANAPVVLEKIKTFQKQQDFFEIVTLVKTLP